LIGFEKSDGDVVDLFNDAPKAAPTMRTKFPVGWIVVAEGPGRGESFSLLSGMSQIGRGEDQAIQLDFGDNSISRTNHAAIVFDPEGKEFLLGHGGKSNIVRLNNKPLISNETLKTGDIIRIGETVLRFVALCDKSFNWSDGATGEDEDVAIA
jgi:predicted component of type VI protein secretion system